MPEKPIRQINDFNIGINPNIYGEGISRIEHFDTITGQARPYRKLVATDMTHGDAGVIKNIVKFARGASGIIYALGMNNQTAYRPTMAKWDATNKYWDNFQSFNKDSAFAEMLFWYGGNLYGLWRDGSAGTTGHMWKMTPTGTLTAQHVTPVNYTDYCDPIFSKATNLEYLGIDNVIYSFNGTTLTAVFSHPLTTFIFTSIAENGIYLNLTGYDSSTLKAESFLWDRNSSVVDVTQKYDLGYDFPIHSAVLGGIHFIITADRASTNIPDGGTQQSKTLTIKYISGDNPKVLRSYVFDTLFSFHVAGTGLSTGEFQDIDKFYFHAQVKFIGDSDYNRVIFSLDETGKLQIVQNLAIDTSSENTFPAIIKERDCFWIGGRTAGTWVTDTTYPTLSAQSSFIETVKYRAKDLNKNLDFVRATITWETMPTGGQVLLATRGDSETTWTTLKTFTTVSSLKGTVNKGGCTTQPSIAKERQFRIESTGGVIITGFQADFEDINSQA